MSTHKIFTQNHLLTCDPVASKLAQHLLLNLKTCSVRRTYMVEGGHQLLDCPVASTCMLLPHVHTCAKVSGLRAGQCRHLNINTPLFCLS